MRISADQTEDTYQAAALYCDVYLDGVKLNDCLTADEERGEVICIARDSNGKLLVDGEAVLREVRKGHVEVRIPEDVPYWVKAALRG